MKISKTLVTAALACCLTSGVSIAQEQNESQAKDFYQVKSLEMIVFPSYSDEPGPNETGEPESDCPDYPLC